jgi:hypothetical protein
MLEQLRCEAVRRTQPFIWEIGGFDHCRHWRRVRSIPVSNTNHQGSSSTQMPKSGIMVLCAGIFPRIAAWHIRFCADKWRVTGCQKRYSRVIKSGTAGCTNSVQPIVNCKLSPSGLGYSARAPSILCYAALNNGVNKPNNWVNSSMALLGRAVLRDHHPRHRRTVSRSPYPCRYSSMIAV